MAITPAQAREIVDLADPVGGLGKATEKQIFDLIGFIDHAEQLQRERDELRQRVAYLEEQVNPEVHLR